MKYCWQIEWYVAEILLPLSSYATVLAALVPSTLKNWKSKNSESYVDISQIARGYPRLFSTFSLIFSFTYFIFRYVISTLCGTDICHSPGWVITLVFWVGYFNSALNPLIYAYFNREFRVAFKKTLQNCCELSFRLVCWKRISGRFDIPINCSNASSELQANNFVRTDIRAETIAHRFEPNISEQEIINLQNEAVIWIRWVDFPGSYLNSSVNWWNRESRHEMRFIVILVII